MICLYRECESGAGKCKIEIKREKVNVERGGVVKGIKKNIISATTMIFFFGYLYFQCFIALSPIIDSFIKINNTDFILFHW